MKELHIHFRKIEKKNKDLFQSLSRAFIQRHVHRNKMRSKEVQPKPGLTSTLPVIQLTLDCTPSLLNKGCYVLV